MKQNGAHTLEEAFDQVQKNLSAWSIPPEFIERVRERYIALPFEKDAPVFSHGSSDDLMACVLTGYVKVYCPLPEGDQTLLRLAVPGDLIGYEEHVDWRGRKTRAFESQALGRCSLALISRELICRLARDLSGDALVQIIQDLNSFWSINVRWLATLIGLPLFNRLELVLSDLAIRAGIKDARGIILIPELAHEDLAEMIGASRPMVSRLLSKMIRAGLIERTGKRYVLLKKWDLECYLPLLSVRPDKNRDSNTGGRRAPATVQVKRSTGPSIAAIGYGGR